MRPLNSNRHCAAIFWASILSTVLAFAGIAAAAERPRIQVNDYQINAELVPRTHRLTAHAVVKFTALDDISVAVFELHNALRPTRVVDANGRTLSVERVTQDSTVRVALPAGMSKNTNSSLSLITKALWPMRMTARWKG